MLLIAQAGGPPEGPLTGVQAIVDGNGVAIAVTGLLIVFVALTAITLFVGALPKLLHALGPWLPEIESHYDRPPTGARPATAVAEGDLEPRMVAAIAWAVHANRKSDP